MTMMAMLPIIIIVMIMIMIVAEVAYWPLSTVLFPRCNELSCCLTSWIPESVASSIQAPCGTLGTYPQNLRPNQ